MVLAREKQRLKKIREVLKLICQNELWTNWKQQSSIIWMERTSGLLLGEEFGRWKLEIAPVRKKTPEAVLVTETERLKPGKD